MSSSEPENASFICPPISHKVSRYIIIHAYVSIVPDKVTHSQITHEENDYLGIGM